MEERDHVLEHGTKVQSHHGLVDERTCALANPSGSLRRTDV